MRALKQLVPVAIAATFFAGGRFVAVATRRDWVERAAADRTHGRHAKTEITPVTSLT